MDNQNFNEQILSQLKDIGKRLDRIETRLDRLETRQDKLEEKIEITRRELNTRLDKQEEKIDKLADKIDELRRDIVANSNHVSISNISTLGIAVAVIYSLLK
ncbi:MAG: hypothetical protein IKT98_10435 [Selenomonadaceae bacterium]|nr:hypothetical protein [Selenomonadaceae bacterium]